MRRLLLIPLPLLAAACTPEPETTGLANPASVFCVDSGGTSEIRQGTDGAYGVCILPDGTEVDEWDYYRAQNEA